jgi:2-octaprenyl-6-methoxyphenol hydroxylase
MRPEWGPGDVVRGAMASGQLGSGLTVSKPLHIAVIGAGPVGLALALLAARRLPRAQVSLFDARPADRDVSADPRTLALSLGSIQLLERIAAWDATRAEPIREIWISQQAPALALPTWLGTPEVRLSANELAVPMLGAVLGYGALVAPMQRAWEAVVAAEPARLHSRFRVPVLALKDLPAGVEVDAGVAECFDLAVVAEGGVFGDNKLADVKHDYLQDAWVGTVTIDGGTPGLAVERFTGCGPAALLPLPRSAEGEQRASLVWCVRHDDDPVRELDDAQRLAVLNTVFDRRVGRIAAISALKCFPLGLAAQRSLVRGRQVRIGNAAQTLHPVAGQGLNLGLRDAYALATALRDAVDTSRAAPDIDAALSRVAWQRAPDRWAMIAATDFLARSFTWQTPGIATLRATGMALLDRVPPLKNALARRMMFGSR